MILKHRRLWSIPCSTSPGPNFCGVIVLVNWPQQLNYQQRFFITAENTWNLQKRFLQLHLWTLLSRKTWQFCNLGLSLVCNLKLFFSRRIGIAVTSITKQDGITPMNWYSFPNTILQRSSKLSIKWQELILQIIFCNSTKWSTIAMISNNQMWWL